jgi:hypothetical protein
MDIMDERPLPPLIEPLDGSALRRSTLEYVSVWYTFFLLCNSGGAVSGDWVGGTAMDSTALHALIAEARGTAAALAETEQRVASFTAELARQDPGAQPAQQTRTPVAKRRNSGWVPAG